MSELEHNNFPSDNETIWNFIKKKLDKINNRKHENYI